MELGSNLVRLSGMVPVKRLSDKSRRLRDFSDEMDIGTEEVSLFPCNISMLSFLRFPIAEGIEDERRLWLASNFTRFWALEISEGTAPESIFLWMNSSDKLAAYAIPFGMEPCKWLNAKSMMKA
uniref:Uncharacterized protein n=1 Tax=Kalanchoe fedtschenkoi TaxID=63787 RepID=A0A7N0V1S0_KALFE